jgi:hypothetical protein
MCNLPITTGLDYPGALIQVGESSDRSRLGSCKRRVVDDAGEQAIASRPKLCNFQHFG